MSPAPTSTAVGELAWLAARETTARRAAHNTHTMSPRHREVMTVGGVGCGTWAVPKQLQKPFATSRL